MRLCTWFTSKQKESAPKGALIHATNHRSIAHLAIVQLTSALSAIPPALSHLSTLRWKENVVRSQLMTDPGPVPVVSRSPLTTYPRSVGGSSFFVLLCLISNRMENDSITILNRMVPFCSSVTVVSDRSNENLLFEMVSLSSFSVVFMFVRSLR